MSPGLPGSELMESWFEPMLPGLFLRLRDHLFRVWSADSVGTSLGKNQCECKVLDSSLDEQTVRNWWSWPNRSENHDLIIIQIYSMLCSCFGIIVKPILLATSRCSFAGMIVMQPKKLHVECCCKLKQCSISNVYPGLRCDSIWMHLWNPPGPASVQYTNSSSRVDWSVCASLLIFTIKYYDSS